MKDIRKMYIGLALAPYVTFEHECFVKGPAVVLSQERTDLRLDGLIDRNVVGSIKLPVFTVKICEAVAGVEVGTRRAAGDDLLQRDE